MNKIRLLFVDDETNVLAALRRMLRNKRDHWDMTLVNSSQAALEALEKAPFDVIISDIKMPGMDGAELLTRVRDDYPGTIRIALSGQVDLNEVIRSIRSVHQYISKPCTAEDLIARIEGALRSKEVLTDPKMLRLVTEIDALPVIPRIFQEIRDELAGPEPSIDRIADSITQDVGLMAKILKLVNSPFFGLPTHIDSMHKAITMLGLETIKALILSTHLFTSYDGQALSGLNLNMLWEHCFRVANIARLIAECDRRDKQTIVNCRMAGLLHDVGKLILINYFPEMYGRVLSSVRDLGGPVCRVERQVFGTSHAEMGAYLMGLWGMSDEVVHAIGYHHDHRPSDGYIPNVITAANAIDHHCVVFHKDYSRIRIRKDMAPELFEEKRLHEWLDYVADHWRDIEAFDYADESILNEILERG
ncbi:response regulator receiver modulated metal dependent phosphohydrolase [Pseudodesulfovibrio mercurii]|uniref:Response regulator receiver modulated metal dependent phosphohydrolase n=1 Tax=Pseudodesulfovibrio mercurii TaxID=641491 RepID=F0JD88_9BACT|nr:response regulator [Pseudodesulfovibrio mercurii]EGB15762.1 response regulator receiver modulated metal dependent phosphohydrolase [Pseudodesulfovibrio mercurii]